MSDKVRCAVVLKHGPPEVRYFLQHSPKDYTSSWLELRGALEAYYAKGCVYTSEGYVD